MYAPFIYIQRLPVQPCDTDTVRVQFIRYGAERLAADVMLIQYRAMYTVRHSRYGMLDMDADDDVQLDCQVFLGFHVDERHEPVLCGVSRRGPLHIDTG